MADQPGTPCTRGRDPHRTHRGAPACKGHNRRTGACCRNDPALAQEVCRYHGANTPQAQRAANARLQLAAQERTMREAVTTLGLPVDVDPAQALLDEVHWTAGHVAWLRAKVQDLHDDDLAWGMTKSKTGGDDRGDTYEAKPSIWYGLYERERDRLIKVCEATIRAGVAERQVRLAEQQGAMVAGAIRQILDRLGLTPQQLELVPQVVPEVLRAIAAQPAQLTTGEP